MFNGLKSIARERAELEHSRVILESMNHDSRVADAFLDLDEDFFESADEEELEALIDKIPEMSDDEINTGINSVLDSDDDMDIDAILGIEVDDEDDDIE